MNHSLKYNLATGDDRQRTQYDGIINVKGKIVWMPPEKFLSLAHALTEINTNEDSLKNIRYRLQNGLPIDFLMLQVDATKNKVTSHNGRHRATVAKELNIEKVPVLIWIKDKDFPPVPEWTEEQHLFVEKTDFESERINFIPDKVINHRGRFFCVPHDASLDTVINILNRVFSTNNFDRSNTSEICEMFRKIDEQIKGKQPKIIRL